MDQVCVESKHVCYSTLLRGCCGVPHAVENVGFPSTNCLNALHVPSMSWNIYLGKKIAVCSEHEFSAVPMSLRLKVVKVVYLF